MKKSDLGQHFIANEEIVKKLIELSSIKKTDRIIEIGAGKGTITSYLAEKSGKVFAFEVDKSMKKELEQIKKQNPNLEVIYNNALKYSWKECDKIISAIPYFLSEAIIIKSIKDKVPEMILIVGETLEDKLKENNTKIGIISNLFFDINPVLKIDARNFRPAPRTNSWIVKFKRKEECSKIDGILKEIVIKNSKIKNAIIYSLIKQGYTKNKSKEILNSFNFDKNILEKQVHRITGKFLILLRRKLGDIVDLKDNKTF